MMYNTLASSELISETAKALKDKGYVVDIIDNGSDALEIIKKIIPKGSSVMNGSSVTLDKIGYTDLLKSGTSGWVDLHAKVTAENDSQKRNMLRKEALMSDFYLGSVHAITKDGEMVIASNSGSQIPHLAFTSPNIIFVIGIQKIVPDLMEAMKRLEEYVYPLENNRMMETYKFPTGLSKILIFKKENQMLGRKINVILVKESLGF